MAPQKKYRKYLRVFWLIFAIPVILIGLMFFLISKGQLGYMPTFEELENPESFYASQVISSDNQVLGKFFNQNRTRVNFEDISPYMVDAIVSIEDKRFYKHSGIDFRGLMRVAVKSLLLGQDTGGGSTITQQLAKNLFPRETNTTSNPIRFALRKFREWVIAVKLEKAYTKDEIIAMYLNKFDFLHLGHGILSASKVYFNTTPNLLNLEQSAMFAGMVKNPSYWDPRKRPETVLKRRNLVLSTMVDQDFIDKETADSVKNIDLLLDYQKVDHKEGLAPYFREYLRKIMTRTKNHDEIEWMRNPLYGWCNKNKKPDGTEYNLYRDGLKIYTTIDSRMQKYAEEALVEHIKNDIQPAFEREFRTRSKPPFPRKYPEESIETSIQNSMRWSERYRVHRLQNLSQDSIDILFNTPVSMNVFSWNGMIDTVMTPIDSIWYYKKFLRAGFMAVTPDSGYVKAYVGGIDYHHFMYDQIMQGHRQVGSIFKPFVYTLAMQAGYSPCYKVSNVPVSFDVVIDGKDSVYAPKFSHTEAWDGKMVTLKTGLAKSLNQISAWALKQSNPQAVIDLVRKMGVESDIDPVYPLCAGAADLRVYEVLGAYTTYANKGIYSRPIFVTRIEDKDGNLLATFQPQQTVAMNQETAYKMLNMMEAVTQFGGTGNRLRFTYEFDNPIAGKTGTTNYNSDGWFVGIVPNLVAGAWVGGEEAAIRFENNSLGQGANLALPIWALFMKACYADSTLNISKDAFEKPANFNLILDCSDEQTDTGNKNEEFDEEF